jgi:regulator of protease activity HflC (stomatin/prohibitin superfamily)
LPFSAQALTINLIYDSTVTSLTNAAQVEDAFAVAVQTFQSLYTNPITVNITVNWGNSDFGNSGSTLDGWPSYAQLTNALRDAATTAADRSALASLPATDPIASQHVYWIPRAEAKALTDFNSYFNINPNDTNIDGGVSFASNILRSHLDRLHGVSLVIFLRAEN